MHTCASTEFARCCGNYPFANCHGLRMTFNIRGRAIKRSLQHGSHAGGETIQKPVLHVKDMRMPVEQVKSAYSAM